MQPGWGVHIHPGGSDAARGSLLTPPILPRREKAREPCGPLTTGEPFD